MQEHNHKPAILIRGAPATGKTTTAKLLSEQLGGVYIDGDKIMSQVQGITQHPKNQLIAFKQTIIKESRKVDTSKILIFDWLSPNKEFPTTFTSLMRALGRTTVPVTLHADRNTYLNRNHSREDPASLGEVVGMKKFFSSTEPGHHLNNSKMTPEQSVQEIVKMIGPEL